MKKTLQRLFLVALIAVSAGLLSAHTISGIPEEVMNQIHHQLGADLFNQSWDLLLKPDRTARDEALLIDTVHASLWHWRQIGELINILRGHWMICHVYTLLEHREEALYQAQLVLEIKEEIDPRDWDLAYCYEAMARVMALHQNQQEFNHYYALALEAGKNIAEEGDRRQFEADMKDEYWFGMKYIPE